jgi:ABC-type multidrug transport system ATPase subunit
MHEDLTVFETVYFSARARRLGDKQDVIKEDVSFVLSKLGLNHIRNSMIRTISGGKKNHNQ